MVQKSEQDRIRSLLKDTITLLCRNGLTFKAEFSIEALIGITLDSDDVMLVSINESIRTELGTKLAASAANNDASDAHDDNYDDYSDASHQNSPVSPNTAAKRRRKRRRSSGHAPKSVTNDSEESVSESEPSQEEPPSKRITAKMKNAVKQEEDDDSKDIVFIKEELDNTDWSQQSQNNSFQPGDLSGIPSTSSSLQHTQQDNFDFLQGNSLVPMGGAGGGGPSLWPDLSQASQQQQQQQQHLGPNMTSPASRRTSTVTSNLPGTPSATGDDSQQGRSFDTTTKTASYFCAQCSKSFVTRAGYQFHMEKHSGKYRYTCQYCGKGFSGSTNLKGHLVHHTDVREFVCPICNKEYNYKQNLEKHMAKVHQKRMTDRDFQLPSEKFMGLILGEDNLDKTKDDVDPDQTDMFDDVNA